MRFADPGRCPSCGNALAGGERCSSCGFLLTSPPARELWQLLQRADTVLADAERASVEQSAPDPVPAPAPVPASPTTSDLPLAPPLPAPPPSRRWSTGSILLGLGALCLVVAGFIFVTVAWGRLGIVPKALILLAVTALVGLAADRVTARRLRGSAEALWLVFLAFLTLDYWAAYGQDLFGLNGAPLLLVVAIATLLGLVVGGAAALRGVAPLGRPVVSASVAAGVAGVGGGAAIGVLLQVDAGFSPFWACTSVLAGLAVVTAAAHRLALVLLAWTSGVGAVVAALGSWGLAVSDVLAHPALGSLAADLHGLPIVVMSLLTLVAGVVVRPARQVAAAVVTGALLLLVLTPLDHAWPAIGASALLAVALAVVAAVAVAGGRSPWAQGVRAAAAIAGLAALVGVVAWVGVAALRLVPDELGLADDAVLPGPWWACLVASIAAGSALAAAGWWPEARGSRPHLLPGAALVAGTGGAAAAVHAGAPLLLVAALVVVTGVAVVLLAPDAVWEGVGLLALPAAALATTGSGRDLVIALPVTSVLGVVAAARPAEPLVRAFAALLASAGAVVTVAQGCHLAGVDTFATACALLAAGLALAGAAEWLLADPVRRGAQAPAVAAGLVGLAAATAAGPSTDAAVLWLVTGLVATLVGRREVVWRGAGVVALGVACLVVLDTSTQAEATAVWAVAGLLCALAATQRWVRPLREPHAALATTLLLLSAASAADLADASPTAVELLVLALAAGLVLVVPLAAAGRLRLAVEVPAAVGAAVAAVASFVGSPAHAALVWTVLGVACVLLGLAYDDRRHLRWAGSAALGVAWVLRLVASDVDVVEAYTAPFAAVLLGLGVWTMLRDDDASSLRVLAPGVSLALLPSLPQALQDPAGLRALLLGLAAVALLVIGVVRHWRAPFVGGAVVTAVLVVANVGPFAAAVPRWVLIAGVGALLLVAGVTWEQRVRDGRAVVRYVATLR